MSKVRDFIRDNMLTLLNLNANKDIADLEYINNILELYHNTLVEDYSVFYVLSRLVLAKNKLTGIDDVDNFTILQYMIDDLNDIIIELHDNDSIILEIMPSEADMISSALYYALTQMTTSDIDVFNHGTNGMGENEYADYKVNTRRYVEHIAENLAKIAEEELGTIVVKRANK